MKKMIKSLLFTAFLAAVIVLHATAQRQAKQLRNNGGDRSLYGNVLPVAPKRRNLQWNSGSKDTVTAEQPLPDGDDDDDDDDDDGPDVPDFIPSGEDPDEEGDHVPSNEGEDINEPGEILPSNDVDLVGEGQNVTVLALQTDGGPPAFETPVGHVHHGSHEEGTPSNDPPLKH